MNAPSKVEAHYNKNTLREWQRLERHRTEFAVTLRVLGDFLPSGPANVLDIGGGPGRYAIALSQQGYQVTLADLSQSCLEFAKVQAAAAGVSTAALIHANALDLSRFESSTFDAVLLMGPMYHLLQESDRIQATREAMRVLRPGGKIFATFVSRLAAFRWAAKFEPSWYLEQKEYALRLLETGMHDQGVEFPNSYFADPGEIVPLMERGGSDTLMVVGCEGAVSMNEEKINELQGTNWEEWVELNYRLGKNPLFHGAAEHLLYVGKKPA